MALTEMPYVELDRHHEQAYVALEDAQTEAVYRHAESLEEKVRKEKIRRMQRREP